MIGSMTTDDNDTCVCVCTCVCLGNGTETVALPQSVGTYRLSGFKWFTSATDADMTLTLARVTDVDGQTTSVPLNVHQP